MSISGIAHIGIAVRDLDEQITYYQEVLGLRLVRQEEVLDQKIRVAFFACGETTIELLYPLSADSPVAKFIEKRGEGIHHIAYAVNGIDATLKHMEDRGVVLIDKAPRPGAHGKRIAFIHPRSTFGVLTELCE
jgi:methylmalonyl-CoA/ethylmalonyl-CoA epimerase